MKQKKINIHEELSKFKHVKYHDEEHRYFAEMPDGKLVEYISGTTFIGLFKEKFDSEEQAKKYAKKHKLNEEEVRELWDFKRDYAAIKGTYLHAFAENYWNNKVFGNDHRVAHERFGMDGAVQLKEDLDKCINMFKQFYLDSSKSLHPIALELVVCLDSAGIAGMIDKLMWNSKAQEIQIWDYKTNKEINTSSKFRKRMKFPVQWLDECEFVVYSLQLSLYKYIIESTTNIRIGDMYLIWITEKNEKYEIFKCMDLREEIKIMIDYYVTQQQQKNSSN